MVAGIGLHQQRIEVEIVQLLRSAADLHRAGRCARSLRRACGNPGEARISRTSSAMKLNRFTTFSGEPVNFARKRSSCVHTPTGQVLEWHCRTMMQPIATSAAVPMPNSSAPIIAAITTSRPVRMPPSVRRVTRWRRLLSVRIWLASVSPISHGTPAYLIELCGMAPVPPTVSGNQDDIRLGLGDARRDGADAGGGDQLHADRAHPD